MLRPPCEISLLTTKQHGEIQKKRPRKKCRHYSLLWEPNEEYECFAEKPHVLYSTVPEFIDPVFAKTSPKRSFQ